MCFSLDSRTTVLHATVGATVAAGTVLQLCVQATLLDGGCTRTACSPVATPHSGYHRGCTLQWFSLWPVCAVGTAVALTVLLLRLPRIVFTVFASQYSLGHCGCIAQFALWLRVAVFTVY